MSKSTEKDVQNHRIRTPKATPRPKREKGNVGFPTGTLTLGPPEPPAGPPDLYANLRRFGTLGPQKPRILPAGSKATLPVASGRPPATPGASSRSPGHPPRPESQSDRENTALRPPRVAGSTCFTAPEQTRVAIGPRKHGTLHGQVACFPNGKPILARKVAFGPRGRAKSRRKSRYFRTVNPARKGIRSPSRDPLTYMQIYYVLAHLGLGNHEFYRPDQNRPFQQPPGAPAQPGSPSDR